MPLSIVIITSLSLSFSFSLFLISNIKPTLVKFNKILTQTDPTRIWPVRKWRSKAAATMVVTLLSPVSASTSTLFPRRLLAYPAALFPSPPLPTRWVASAPSPANRCAVLSGGTISLDSESGEWSAPVSLSPPAVLVVSTPVLQLSSLTPSPGSALSSPLSVTPNSPSISRSPAVPSATSVSHSVSLPRKSSLLLRSVHGFLKILISKSKTVTDFFSVTFPFRWISSIFHRSKSCNGLRNVKRGRFEKLHRLFRNSFRDLNFQVAIRRLRFTERIQRDWSSRSSRRPRNHSHHLLQYKREFQSEHDNDCISHRIHILRDRDGIHKRRFKESILTGESRAPLGIFSVRRGGSFQRSCHGLLKLHRIRRRFNHGGRSWKSGQRYPRRCFRLRRNRHRSLLSHGSLYVNASAIRSGPYFKFIIFLLYISVFIKTARSLSLKLKTAGHVLL